jgi:N-acyl-phosphatidylethanolamine-hydrolysing phospholipase D
VPRAVTAVAAVAIVAAACTTPREAPRHVQVHVAPAAVAIAATDPDTDTITVSWVGHATVLIGIRGHWFLTDPVFGARIAGGALGRHVAAAMRPDELPPLDAILISHAHFDHLDLPSLRALADVPLLVPPGMPTFLVDLPQREIVPLDTWQTWSRGGVTITAVPASHGDGRYLVDRWHTRTHTGWVIAVGERTVYFAGDTGYIPDQARELARRFHLDVGIIPVGPAGRPRWLERMRADVHATPDAAMKLFRATGAQWMVPVHFGTFFEPADSERPLIEAAVARHHLERWVRLLDIGETTTFLY